MTKCDQVDKGNRLRQWLTRPSGAAAAGAVAALLIGFCPVLGDNFKALFIFVTMFSDARESPAQLLAASTLASLTAGGILGLCIWIIVRFVRRSHLPPIARGLIAFVAAPISLMVALVLPMIGVGEWDDYLARAPSDSALIHKFQENRSSFERMERMLHEDPEPMWAYLDTADSSENAESKSYGSLLRKLNIVLSHTGDAENDFYVWNTGWLDGPSDAKGYCYRTTPPANLCGRLDGIDKSPARDSSTDFSVYRRIEGNWYLYYHYSSGH